MEKNLPKRHVWRTPKAGNIDHLSLSEESLPKLGTSSIRIKVRAVGLNFADIFALTGLYSATPKGSFIPGLEYAGDVIQVGDNVSSIRVGQRMMGVTRFGAYSSVIDTIPDYCFPLPDSWCFAEGAAYPVQTLTAWYALKILGAAGAGKVALIQSAAGGVGLQALQLCQHLQLEAIPVVGNRVKQQFLTQRGYSNVVVRDQGFMDSIANLVGEQGFDLILDGVGGQQQKQLFERLNPMGRLVVFGAAEFTPGEKRPRYFSSIWKYMTRPQYDVLSMISENRSVMAFNLIWLWDQIALMRDLMAELSLLSLPAPYVGKTLSFEDAHEGIQHLRSGTSIGKVVLTLD